MNKQLKITNLETTTISRPYDHRVEINMIEGEVERFYVMLRKGDEPAGEGVVITKSAALRVAVEARDAAVKAADADFFNPNVDAAIASVLGA